MEEKRCEGGKANNEALTRVARATFRVIAENARRRRLQERPPPPVGAPRNRSRLPSVLAENGIDFHRPLTPMQIAEERKAREKRRNTRALQLAMLSRGQSLSRYLTSRIMGSSSTASTALAQSPQATSTQEVQQSPHPFLYSMAELARMQLQPLQTVTAQQQQAIVQQQVDHQTTATLPTTTDKYPDGATGHRAGKTTTAGTGNSCSGTTEQGITLHHAAEEPT